MPARWPSGRRMSGDGQLRPIIHCLYAPCQGEPGGGPSDTWAGPTTSQGRATPQGLQVGAALSGRRAAEAGTAARTAMRWERRPGRALSAWPRPRRGMGVAGAAAAVVERWRRGSCWGGGRWRWRLAGCAQGGAARQDEADAGGQGR